jgi:hypothetical protein
VVICRQVGRRESLHGGLGVGRIGSLNTAPEIWVGTAQSSRIGMKRAVRSSWWVMIEILGCVRRTLNVRLTGFLVDTLNQ